MDTKFPNLENLNAVLSSQRSGSKLATHLGLARLNTFCAENPRR